MFTSVVNLKALKHNINLVKKALNCKLCFVVKADAYGHGMERVANYAACDVDEFAVATLGEAIDLSKCKLNKAINILGCSDNDFNNFMLKNGSMSHIIPSISDESELKYLKNFKKINIKVNSGMNRLGVRPQNLASLITACKSEKKEIHSVFTHLFNADELALSTNQYNIFCEHTANLLPKPMLHCLASNALILPPYMQLDMARVGIAAYGYHKSIKDLIPVMSVYTSILQVFSAKKGEYVSYGNFVLDHDATLASVRIGYADGFRRRALNEDRFVSVNGKLCPVVGQVCMDITVIDISNIALTPNQRVYILGESIDGNALASSYGTIIYEVLTGFNYARARREYIE